MIRTWTLENFKSAGRRTELDFAPLTVFAGPNSSGKSTIVQSILLTAQTLHSAVAQRPIILNGHMARLGSFTDIVTGADELAEVTIGFGITLDPDLLYRPGRSGSWREMPPYWWHPHTEPFDVDCEFSFSMRGDEGEVEALRLQPRLESSSLVVRGTNEDNRDGSRMAIHRSDVDAKTRIKRLQLHKDSIGKGMPELLRFEVEGLAPDQLRSRSRTSLERARVVGVAVHHFLPSYLAVSFDAVETEVRRVVDSLTAKGTLSWRELDDDIASILEQPAVRAVIAAVLARFREKLKEDPLEGLFAGIPRRFQERVRTQLLGSGLHAESGAAEQLREMMVSLPPPLRGELAGIFAERERALTNAVRRGRKPRFDIAHLGLPEAFQSAVGGTRRYFSGSVRYLGPLRDEPKAVYPLIGAMDPGDVGLRGEHTAAVLEIHRGTSVETIDPTYFAEDIQLAPKIIRRPLLRATLDWLEYMGVGTDLSTEDRGKLGHELKVSVSDESARHDLTQVGVGVSQVLPILVMSLMAEAGATLIFEQPELHLHPRVQTRLADFFVALTMTRKQCIVETHSEYLINQLRFRAVISDGDAVSSQLRIYFVEKYGDQSAYRPVHINEYGVIQDWPKGFFDEKERTVAKIMEAALAKRKRNT